MNQKEKMIMGEIYHPTSLRLVLDRAKANKIITKYNRKSFNEIDMRNGLLKKLLHTKGNFWIKPPFYCDYGYNIYLGKNVMLNYGCVFLDVCPIYIGNHTFIGPYTQIYTACHAVEPEKRLKDIEFGKPVVIGDNVWIGGNCTILAGISIGNNSVIGAGSVVTKNIPDNVVAVGNPCKVIRQI